MISRSLFDPGTFRVPPGSAGYPRFSFFTIH